MPNCGAPRPSPDRPTQTAVHDTHEQHHSSASARPSKAVGLGRGSGDSGDSGDSGRGTRSRLAGQGQRHRQAAARQKPNETRAIGGRERARLACESGPGGEQVEKSNSKPSGADRKWSQRIALTAPRSRGRWVSWEIIKNPILPVLGERARLHCQSTRGSSEAATGGATPHCGSLRGSRRGAAQSKPS